MEPMPERLPITLILPAFNEARIIEQVIRDIRQVGDFRIVVIDDGSTDGTAAKVLAMGEQVVRHPLNRGAGAACQTGISLARKYGWPYLAFMDSDGQHFPEDLAGLITTMQEQQADIVIGSRFAGTHNQIPHLRRFFNTVANILTNSFCAHHYTDTQSGFRLLNQRAIATIDLLQDDFSYCSEMIILAERAKLKVAEAPIQVRYTDYSVSKGQDFQVGLLTAFHFLWKL
ncbi:MAG: glycosyl transferase, partial [Bacteroidetes bacterium]